jgi:TM2 domain-containing membrane protein YozV
MKASFSVRLLCSLAAVAVSSAVLSAQNAGEVDSKGRVLTKVVVTMNEPGSFGRPVAGLTFLVVTENGDRVSVVTDDAGVASTWLSPASYRFITPDPVEWQNKAYSWDVIVPVKAASAVIKFSQDNATKVLAVMSPSAARATVTAAAISQPGNQAALQPQATGQIPFQYKDGTTATLLSLLITGGGQMYSGETGRGLGMLLGGVGAIVVGYAASGCDSYGCNNTDGLVAGYLVATGLWITSLIDAHSSAARHNALAPRSALIQNISPVVESGSQGTTRLGLSLRY